MDRHEEVEHDYKPVAIIAWCIAGRGMYMLARVFQALAERKPDLDAGVYAYAKAGFGDYPGFLPPT